MPIVIQNGLLHVLYKGDESMCRISEIDYIEASNWLCKIYTTNDVILCGVRLGYLYEQIKDLGFLRCHKGYVVNERRIASINTAQIILVNSRAVPVGRTYKDRVPMYKQTEK